MKSIMMIVIGWSSWLFVLIGLLIDRRETGRWAFTRVLLFMMPAVLSQAVCYWTLSSVLGDPGASRVLLIGSGVGALVLSVALVVFGRRPDPR